jgi:ribonuclease D
VLVTDSDDVNNFCHRAAESKFVAVDTEFVREKTYWPILCLVQIATTHDAVAIDPLTEGIDLRPLFELMTDTSILKVFHSASQDLQIMFNVIGKTVKPVFDTQIAAMVCGYGDQPAYATLVQRIVGESLDKKSQMTDWSRRPLTDDQIEYAIGDVTYLIHVYNKLTDELGHSGRLSWAQEEMERLLNDGLYDQDARELWRRVRLRRPTRRALAILREITEWRELTARKTNVPRGWVCRDEALAEIALNAPQTPDALEKVRGINERFAYSAKGRAAIRAVRAGLDLPDDQCPDPQKGRPPQKGHETLVALLQALLKLRCDENKIAPQIVANRKDLDRMATEDEPDIKTLTGWRRKIYGNDALSLKRGEIALTADGLKVRVVHE